MGAIASFYIFCINSKSFYGIVFLYYIFSPIIVYCFISISFFDRIICHLFHFCNCSFFKVLMLFKFVSFPLFIKSHFLFIFRKFSSSICMYLFLSCVNFVNTLVPTSFLSLIPGFHFHFTQLLFCLILSCGAHFCFKLKIKILSGGP